MGRADARGESRIDAPLLGPATTNDRGADSSSDHRCVRGRISFAGRPRARDDRLLLELGLVHCSCGQGHLCASTSPLRYVSCGQRRWNRLRTFSLSLGEMDHPETVVIAIWVRSNIGAHGVRSYIRACPPYAARNTRRSSTGRTGRFRIVSRVKCYPRQCFRRRAR